jgi:hypothetical protein
VRRRNLEIRSILVKRIMSVLGWRGWPWVLALTAIVVSLPALRFPPLNDDYVQRAMLVGSSQGARLGFVPAEPASLRTALSDLLIAVHPDQNLKSLKTYGALPWWTCEQYRVAFWRPLASLTHWLDYRLLPQSFTWMHLHSILWYSAVVLAVAMLYRRLIDLSWVAGLAGLLYVLDDNGYFPTMWVANRNLLMSLFFGILAILAHDRWRRQTTSEIKNQKSRLAPVLVLLCLLGSILSAEAGVATFAYLFAYEATLERGPWRRRALALAPSVVVILGWRVLYNLQGYGTVGGGFYFDPGRDPAGYALAVLARAPFLWGGQWTTVPADLFGFLPPVSKALMWLLLAGVALLLPIALLPMLRVNRRARFWLVGMYVAALPFCATIPMSRSLLFAGLGGFGLIAEALAGWLRREPWTQGLGRRRGVVHAVVIALAMAHLPWAAVTRVTAARVASAMDDRVARTMALRDAGCRPDQDLVVVNACNPLSLLYEPYRNICQNEPLPRSLRMLTPGFNAVRLLRTGPRRVIVRAVSHSLLDCQPGKRMDFVYLYRYLSDVRGTGHPLRAGQRISLPRMEVEVLAVDDRGLPTEAAFDFDVSLEDASLKWLFWEWESERYEPFSIPPVGASVGLVGPF